MVAGRPGVAVQAWAREMEGQHGWRRGARMGVEGPSWASPAWAFSGLLILFLPEWFLKNKVKLKFINVFYKSQTFYFIIF